MRVLYFAGAADAAGTPAHDFPEFAGGTSADVWRAILSRHPALEPLKNSCRLARNASHASENEIFQPGDEVAVLPPVSGG
jgi:molybdopterin synthase catalytic subunit/molybdopterin synthase sulfur carrier subunit